MDAAQILCPDCGNKVVDISADGGERRFLCIGPEQHEWTHAQIVELIRREDETAAQSNHILK